MRYIVRVGMALQVYAVYTRCTHCGVYDKDVHWCALCGRSKDGGVVRAEPVHAPPVPPARMKSRTPRRSPVPAGR